MLFLLKRKLLAEWHNQGGFSTGDGKPKGSGISAYFMDGRAGKPGVEQDRAVCHVGAVAASFKGRLFRSNSPASAAPIRLQPVGWAEFEQEKTETTEFISPFPPFDECYGGGAGNTGTWTDMDGHGRIRTDSDGLRGSAAVIDRRYRHRAAAVVCGRAARTT